MNPLFFWRRRSKPIHEQLAAGTDLLDWEPKHGPVVPRFPGTLDALHGGRPRRWDAVATVEAPRLPGDEVHFAALPDGTLVVDEDVPDGALTPLVETLEQDIEPPYRADAVRQGEDVWAVAANAIDVVRLREEIPGDEIELALNRGERTVKVDGEPTLIALPTLEAVAGARHTDYVARASRLDGDLWEVAVSAL